jgi:hypothetical protein
MMGQRVLPQRSREPLQRTQRLFWLARVRIWLSLGWVKRFLLSMFCSQLPEEGLAETGGGTAYLVAVVMSLVDGFFGFLCFLHLDVAKAWRRGVAVNGMALSLVYFEKT